MQWHCMQCVSKLTDNLFEVSVPRSLPLLCFLEIPAHVVTTHEHSTLNHDANLSTPTLCIIQILDSVTAHLGNSLLKRKGSRTSRSGSSTPDTGRPHCFQCWAAAQKHRAGSRGSHNSSKDRPTRTWEPLIKLLPLIMTLQYTTKRPNLKGGHLPCKLRHLWQIF